jgi:A/G-specific adenine glycosylase
MGFYFIFFTHFLLYTFFFDVVLQLIPVKMNKQSNDNLLSRQLQEWYRQYRRDLPWRDSNNPYAVWVSEIILQQTRVNQGRDYFLRFMERFPDIESLAKAPEDEVMKCWEGLGYYSRARNLHAAARQVVEEFKGHFPASHDEMLRLKGVGEYTAAAVASIVFGQPYPVVDGNVFRVLSRLFAIKEPIDTSTGRKLFTGTAAAILDPQDPGTHNQAIMELGALVCTPRLPRCGECPLQHYCMAFERGEVSAFPVKKGKPVLRRRYLNYFHIEQDGFTFIRRREDADIWRNLYEFPLIETETESDLAALQSDPRFHTLFPPDSEVSFRHVCRLKHLLTHLIIHADFYRVELPGTKFPALEGDFLRIGSASLSEYPVSRLLQRYLETI